MTLRFWFLDIRRRVVAAVGVDRVRMLPLFGAAILLVACGGGGGGGSGGGSSTYELLVRAEGSGGVVSTPAGIDCGAGSTTCRARFAAGASVQLAATAVDGNAFTGWSGSSSSCSGTGNCTVTMTADQAVTASFATDAVARESLSLTVSGKGSVTSSPSGIDCAQTCRHDFTQGDRVTLTAAPRSGYRFSGWGGACAGNGACTVALTASRSVTARFVQLGSSSDAALNVAVVGNGTVASAPGGIRCGSSCAAVFDAGTRVTLTATPADGKRFAGWSGTCSGTAATCSVDLDDVATVVAEFEAIPVQLRVSRSGSGTVTSNPAGIQCGSTCRTTVDQGSTTALAAVPAVGWTFTSWGGACSGVTAPSCTLDMEGDRNVSATFTRVGYAVVVQVQGSGTVTDDADRLDCTRSCTETFGSALTLRLRAVAGVGYRFAGWGGDCSGTAGCTVTAAKDAPSVTARFIPDDEAGDLGIGACVPSGKGTDYAVGPGAGQIPTLDRVPWESLGPGDTVRIFHKATPYRGKMLIAARGTASAPVRVCGVKSASGQRPVIDGENAVARRGLRYTAASLNNVQETRSLILVDRLDTQEWGIAFPAHVLIDGLELRGARPGNFFTNSFGQRQEYDDFGGCIWIERGHDVTVADNVIHDCTNGIFSRSTDFGDFAVTRSVRVAGNELYGNGVVGDEHQHNTYLQSVGVVVEFNRYGPLRAGALGNAIKDRSVDTVIRYNRIEEGAHAIDLVEAEDFPDTATADPGYRSAFVYGNQIVKSGDTGSVIHYGGDHYGSAPGNRWGEPIYRKGTLYFFSNTVLVTGTSGTLFQLSTTQEQAQVWNNIFAFSGSVSYPSLRQNSEIGTGWTAGGIVNLGRNWINSNWHDGDPWHTIPGRVDGTRNLLTGSSLPFDASTLKLKAGSTPVDAAQSAPSAARAYTVDFELDGRFRKVRRAVRGSDADLGALER